MSVTSDRIDPWQHSEAEEQDAAGRRAEAEPPGAGAPSSLQGWTSAQWRLPR